MSRPRQGAPAPRHHSGDGPADQTLRPPHRPRPGTSLSSSRRWFTGVPRIARHIPVTVQLVPLYRACTLFDPDPAIVAPHVAVLLSVKHAICPATGAAGLAENVVHTALYEVAFNAPVASPDVPLPTATSLAADLEIPESRVPLLTDDDALHPHTPVDSRETTLSIPRSL